MSAIMASSPSSCLTAAAVLWGLVAVSGDITTPCSWWNCGDDVRTTTMAPGKPGVSAACTKCLQQAAKPGDCSVYCATTTTTPVCDPYATPPVARPVQDLSTEEKLNLVKAFKMMKNTPSSFNLSDTLNADAYAERGDPANAWDYFPPLHAEATTPIVGVHTNWQFQAWHRQILNRFHQEIRRITGDPCFVLPYWNFEDPAALGPLLDEDVFLGGDGNPDNLYIVETGLLVTDAADGLGGWPMYQSFHGANDPHLQRNVGGGILLCLDQNGNGHIMDTTLLSLDIDTKESVGPFNYRALVSNKSARPREALYAPPDPRNADCPYSTTDYPTCIRRYDTTDSTGTVYNLTCKLFGTTPPQPGDTEKCQNTP